MPKISLASRYLQAWNSHDPSRILDFFYKDATYVDSGLNRQVSGHKLGYHFEKIINLCPDVEFELLDGGITGSGRSAIQWRARGKDLSKLCPQLDVSHLETLCGLDYIVHHQGQLLSTHVYFDLTPQLTPNSSYSDQYINNAPQQVAKRYSKTGLAEQDLTAHQQRLNQLMLEHKLYLNNDLTLAQLATAVGLSSNHLSQVINSQFNLSFYDFLNYYRIEHAKTRLTQAANKADFSTLDIAFDSGFGSISAFYRAFQLHVKMSPTQYRKRYSR